MTKTHVVHVMYGCEVYIQTYCNSSHVQIRVSCNQSIALWRHACDLLNTSHLHHFIFYTAHAKQCLLSLFIYWELSYFHADGSQTTLYYIYNVKHFILQDCIFLYISYCHQKILNDVFLYSPDIYCTIYLNKVFNIMFIYKNSVYDTVFLKLNCFFL